MEDEKYGPLLGLSVLVLGGLLTIAGASLAKNGASLSPDSWNYASLVGVTVSAFGLLTLFWWILSFSLALATELLARQGKRSEAMHLRGLSPEFMRRTACLVLSVSFTAAPAYADGQDAKPASVIHEAPGAENPAVQGPSWLPIETPDVSTPSWRPSALPFDGSVLLKEGRAVERSAGRAASEVVVQTGDSLWTIAAQHLGPTATHAEVAEAWPRWYEVNREVIGAQPDLLKPGQVLKTPTTAQ